MVHDRFQIYLKELLRPHMLLASNNTTTYERCVRSRGLF